VMQYCAEMIEIIAGQPAGNGVRYAVAQAVGVPGPLSLDDLKRFLPVRRASVPDDQNKDLNIRIIKSCKIIYLPVMAARDMPLYKL